MNRRSFILTAAAAVASAAVGLRELTEVERTREALLDGIADMDPDLMDVFPRACPCDCAQVETCTGPCCNDRHTFHVDRAVDRADYTAEVYRVPHFYEETGEFGAMMFTAGEYELYRLGMERRSAMLLEAAGCPASFIRLICAPIEMDAGDVWDEMDNMEVA